MINEFLQRSVEQQPRVMMTLKSKGFDCVLCLIQEFATVTFWGLKSDEVYESIIKCKKLDGMVKSVHVAHAYLFKQLDLECKHIIGNFNCKCMHSF